MHYNTNLLQLKTKKYTFLYWNTNTLYNVKENEKKEGEGCKIK